MKDLAEANLWKHLPFMTNIDDEYCSFDEAALGSDVTKVILFFDKKILLSAHFIFSKFLKIFLSSYILLHIENEKRHASNRQSKPV